jgi:hypothetical protein
MADTDLATRLMDDMDPALLDFLQNKVNSFIKWDLVRFFHDNPNAADTPENIARYTGRDVRMIESELSGLVRAGVLQEKEVSGVRVFTLSKDRQVRQLIENFVAACNDRQFRVKAIYHVIRSMR